MLKLSNISATIADTPILKNISLEFTPGSTTALLGPNGSGKSTFGNMAMAAPFVQLSPESQITFFDEDITALSTHERAQKGFFLTFQSPLPLAGVSAMDMLRAILVNGSEKKYSAQELHALTRQYCEELQLPVEFLQRPLYEGFSGGERKKMEALQAVLFAPKLVIFDELDTGVDVDALKIIVTFLHKHLPANTTKIFITHSHKLLGLIKPEKVVVLKNGSVVAEGDATLAHHIEHNGFEAL